MCQVPQDPAAVAAEKKAREEASRQMNWLIAAGLGGFVLFAAYQFLRDTKDAIRASIRPRQPWDV
ncbi:MAG TPA: hypothetical protein VKE74_21615 [Gemmataceae bacterium]|nr:hypothetical protein [Gemmataceae bacterium]